ncbi:MULTISPECIES: dTDP-4-dehydrorhamnose 3,5-epimerase family protein [unclassified Afipia]|uniref:dTDP-4-dehydrorhamnose 3,5-epimerase family protein n=1 Tax=unclassified Afipia TaxID=2642050 RepID=UPI00040675A4|nr:MULTISPECIES: dTDP-4-dehydrorhamnose 3,5-epimerase family protein [unclassified Afipia]
MNTSKNSTPATFVTPNDFVQDAPVAAAQAPAITPVADLIDGVTVTPLVARTDHRGALTELLTTRDGLSEPIVHVYEVEAKAGSIRGWVYHRHQFDRLAYTRGRFRIALFDIRQDSPTFNQLSVLILGKERPGLLRIPPFVVHAVQNLGEDATFTNMPTKAYNPRDPDKCRLPIDDPRIPFSFRD